MTCYNSVRVLTLYIYRSKPDDTRHKTMVETYLPPNNIPNMVVPKTNTEVWELLNKGVTIVDSSVQKIQSIQLAGLAALLRIIESVGNQTGDMTEEQLQEMTDATIMTCMAFSGMHQIRKDLIRNALGYPVAKFCTWDTRVGQETLFQELNKKVKERDETSESAWAL